MGQGLNKVMLIGNVGNEPEMKYAGSGTAILQLSLATTERRKKGGEWGEETQWHRIVIFGKTAEGLSKHVRKGSALYVEGRMETREWESKGGERHFTTEVVAQEVKFLAGEGRRGGRASQADDDIPF